MSESEDKRILRLLSSNKNEAYEYLYSHYYTRMVLFADRYELGREVVEDLVQEVFVSLLQVRVDFRSMPQLKSYLYHSLRNRCLNHLRHTLVHNRYVETEMFETEHSFENAVIEEEVYSQLIEAIDTLPPQTREVILHSLQKKNNCEIAELMGLSVETVKSYKKAGKKKLIDHFVRLETLPVATLVVTVIKSL